MSAMEKSDLPEVARKRANKAASAAAEPVERRGGAKENAEYRSRGRAHLHVAGRFRTHTQLGVPRPRQHLGPADDLARRARSSDHQLLMAASFGC
jgi:hypothetical protein